MAAFDYITSKEFRESLEADYAELRRCAENKAWKSVQVLAGSIVEALLVDYLLATKHPSRPNKDPLKLDLAEAITICRQEKVLSDRTADLCSVVRSYRNLIHPGRMVRMEEPAPSASSSTIALGLIELITEDLTKVLRAKVGLTAEQILSKVERDANALTILPHLLLEVNEHQRDRLLLEIIVPAYMSLLVQQRDDPFDEGVNDVKDRLRRAFRTIFDAVPEPIRQRVASEFVRVLREEDGQYVLDYGAAFFNAGDMAYLPESNRAMVKEHLLGTVSGMHNADSINRIFGIEAFLTTDEVRKWLDPFVRTLVSPTMKAGLKERVRNQVLVASTIFTTNEIDDAISERLASWVKFFNENTAPEKAEAVAQLRKEFDDQRIPF